MSIVNNISSYHQDYQKGDEFSVSSSIFVHKEKLKHISISQFSALTDTNRDTIVYYIKEGLITPALTEKNGYQYFYPEQIQTMMFIKYMRRFGVHINEIKSMLKGMNTNDIYTIMDLHKQDIENRMQNIRQALNFLEQFEEFICFIEEHPVDIPFFAELKETNLNLTPVRFCQSLNNIRNAKILSDYLNIEDDGLPEFLMCCRIPEKVILSGDFCKLMHENNDTDYEKVIKRPAGTYACMIHQGGNGTVKETVQSLLNHIVLQGKKLSGDAYVLNSTGYFNLTSSDHSKYLIEINV